MNTSATSSARPMSSPVNFLRIMAVMSVPPVLAPKLNSSAEPSAGRITAKKSSSIF